MITFTNKNTYTWQTHFFKVPEAVNEPVKAYKPGSEELTSPFR